MAATDPYNRRMHDERSLIRRACDMTATVTADDGWSYPLHRKYTGRRDSNSELTASHELMEWYTAAKARNDPRAEELMAECLRVTGTRINPTVRELLRTPTYDTVLRLHFHLFLQGVPREARRKLDVSHPAAGPFFSWDYRDILLSESDPSIRAYIADAVLSLDTFVKVSSPPPRDAIYGQLAHVDRELFVEILAAALVCEDRVPPIDTSLSYLVEYRSRPEDPFANSIFDRCAKTATRPPSPGLARFMQMFAEAGAAPNVFVRQAVGPGTVPRQQVSGIRAGGSVNIVQDGRLHRDPLLFMPRLSDVHDVSDMSLRSPAARGPPTIIMQDCFPGVVASHDSNPALIEAAARAFASGEPTQVTFLPSPEGPSAGARPAAEPAPEGAQPTSEPVQPAGGSECIICLEARRSVVLMPCKHLCVCSTCASKVNNCPVCRAYIHNKISVFFP
jgi:hypothetical protein